METDITSHTVYFCSEEEYKNDFTHTGF